MKTGAPVFSAVLLAGGRSTRMGTDKALLATGAMDGRMLWQRQFDVLAQAGAAEIMISARPEQTWVPTGAAVVRDAVPDAGPLAGIVAALERAAHGHLAVLAVDLPAMRPEWFESLLAECRPGVGAVGRQAGAAAHGEFFEPLAAIYPEELMVSGREALARGEFSLQRFLASAVAEGRMEVRPLTPADVALFENWNEGTRAVNRAPRSDLGFD